MDQKKCGSGIGNYLAAEIMYRAGISPHRTGSSLTDEEVVTLVQTIKHTIKLAYRKNKTGYMIGLPQCLGGPKPVEYQPEIRLAPGERFQFQVYRQAVDPLGNEVVGEKILRDRTTWWVPAVQV